MLSPDRVPNLEPLGTAAADYAVVRRAIAHIRGNWQAQPEIEIIAEAAGVTATELHHLFRRWAGLTPKAFLQALTLDHARTLLRSSASVLDASLGGTGGCPFAPRATGNIPTEDLVYLLHGMGIQTGIDLERLIQASLWLGERLGKELPAMLPRAGDFSPVSRGPV